MMNLKIVIHIAEEGGYWGEAPAIPGCVSQGETVNELLANIKEAVEGCLSVDIEQLSLNDTDRLMEVTI